MAIADVLETRVAGAMTQQQNPTGKGMRIDIGVCTYRRPHLEETLRSLGMLQVPAGATVRVIVADNDQQPTARPLVERLAAELSLEIAYVHCPASNISLARNACLDNSGGDFLAFIDDDSTAMRQWLAELLRTAETTDADAVLGPVHSVYSGRAPTWMKRGDFHSTEPVWKNGKIVTGYSGNVLLRRSSPHIAGRRFDLALGRTGGEDTEYFTLVHESGGRIAFSPDAIVLEPVPDERARFSWLAKRQFRSGQTHGRLIGAAMRPAGVISHMGLAAAKAIFCFAAAGAAAFRAQSRNGFALRGILHIGTVSGLLGIREIRLYGNEPVERRGHAA